MVIWKQATDLDSINALMKGTMCESIGIEVVEVGEDYVKAIMPVDQRTSQHMGIVHGGASVALAETVGSVAANLCCEPGHYAVGLDINANHIRAGRPPLLVGVARPLHVGSSTSVWDIRIHDRGEALVCASRLTMAVLKSPA